MNMKNAGLKQGAVLMLIGSLAFIGYAVVFLFRNFAGSGFELGVQTLNGVTRDNLNSLNPAIMHYIGHLHVAVAGFIAATGIAVAALSWGGCAAGNGGRGLPPLFLRWWVWRSRCPITTPEPSSTIGSRTLGRFTSRLSCSWSARCWPCARCDGPETPTVPGSKFANQARVLLNLDPAKALGLTLSRPCSGRTR